MHDFHGLTVFQRKTVALNRCGGRTVVIRQFLFELLFKTKWRVFMRRKCVIHVNNSEIRRSVSNVNIKIRNRARK